MKAYKGFNKDMTCRDFQYEEGKTYQTDFADMCNSGFHACINPLDTFGYYVPGKSVYHEVEIEENGQRSNEDTKIVGKKITIGAALSVAGICKAHFEFTKSQCVPVVGKVAGVREAVSVGDKASAAAGENGSAAAGENGSAAAGWKGSAVSRGDSTVGKNGVACVRGNDVKAKGALGSVIVVVIENDDNWEIKEWKDGVVDGINLKPDVFYTVVNGEFVEVE